MLDPLPKAISGLLGEIFRFHCLPVFASLSHISSEPLCPAGVRAAGRGTNRVSRRPPLVRLCNRVASPHRRWEVNALRTGTWPFRPRRPRPRRRPWDLAAHDTPPPPPPPLSAPDPAVADPAAPADLAAAKTQVSSRSQRPARSHHRSRPGRPRPRWPRGDLAPRPRGTGQQPYNLESCLVHNPTMHSRLCGSTRAQRP